ncbi:MAG: hypothetical protein HQL19_01035 [Candidatus Omnitrophica bacterium]|nr:hypothetical protein [Candidatus Omnitrophota bacterium]
MRMLSLKLNEDVLMETDKVVKELKMSRNGYINDALRMFNAFNRRRMLKKVLHYESGRVMADSMDVLKEMEALNDPLPKY